MLSRQGEQRAGVDSGAKKPVNAEDGGVCTRECQPVQQPIVNVLRGYPESIPSMSSNPAHVKRKWKWLGLVFRWRLVVAGCPPACLSIPPNVLRGWGDVGDRQDGTKKLNDRQTWSMP